MAITNLKNLQIQIVLVLSLAVVLLFSQSLFAEVDGAALLNMMREKDMVSQAVGYKISFVMATNNNAFRDPNQGMIFTDCESTWVAEDTFAMKITYNYEHPPVYAPARFRNYREYDYYKGNLTVWRTLEKYVISSPDRNDTLEKLRVFHIDPNNRIVDTGDNIQIHRFNIGDTNNRYQFNQFELATGRGFSKHLGTNVSTVSQPLRLTEITSQGSWRGSPQGNWKLILDPLSDNLVREAVFTVDASDQPSIEVTTGGVIEKDGIRIAKSGIVRYSSDFELNIEVMGISKVVGKNELFEEVSACLNEPLPKGAGIIDMRGDKPVRSTVK